MESACRLLSLGFRVSRSRFYGLGFSVQDLGFGVVGSGVCGLGFLGIFLHSNAGLMRGEYWSHPRTVIHREYLSATFNLQSQYVWTVNGCQVSGFDMRGCRFP